MKKFTAFVILLFLLLLPIGHIQAASQQAYQDYLFQFSQYRQKYSEFQVAKNTYEKFKTLESQTQALSATKTMLTQRAQLLHAYLVFLSEKVTEEEGLTNVNRGLYQSLIRTELTFLEGHSQLIPSINSIEDATTVSEQLESHYQVLQIAIRQIVAGLSVGRLSVISRNFDKNVSAAQTLVNTSAGLLSSEKVATVNRWFLQITNKKNLYQQKVEEITRDSTGLTGYNVDDVDQKFNEILGKIGEAKQYLSDDISYLGEVVRTIKYLQ